MNERKEKKIRETIKRLEDLGHYVETYENGHIKVLGCNYWCTSEKFRDEKRKVFGMGLKKFIEHLEGL